MPWMIAGAALVGAAASSSAANNAADKQAAGTSSAIDASQSQNAQSRSDLAPYRDAGTAALGRLRQLLGIETPGVSKSDLANELRNSDFYRHVSNLSDDELISQFKQHAPTYLNNGTDLTGAELTPRNQDTARKLYDQLQGLEQGASAGGTGGDSGSLLRKFSTDDLNADPVYNSGLQFGLDEGTKALERRAAASGGYDSGAELKALTRFGNDYGSTKANESYGRFTNDQDRTFGKLTGIAGLGSGATNVGVGAGAQNSANLSNLITGGANAQGAAAIAGGNAISGAASNLGQYAMLRQLTGGGQRTVTPAPNYDYPG